MQLAIIACWSVAAACSATVAVLLWRQMRQR